MDTENVKFCVLCKHCYAQKRVDDELDMYNEFMCRITQKIIDIVNGSTREVHLTCAQNRYGIGEDFCGKEGKYWEKL